MDIRKFESNTLKKSQIILRCKPELEFIGILSYGVEFVLASAEYMMKATHGRSSLGFTDGKTIYLGVLPELTPPKLAFIIAHEILHIISLHIQRLGTRDPIIWNLATDHVINRMLKEYSTRGGMLKEPSDGLVFYEKIHQTQPNICADELYNILLKQKENQKLRIEVYEINKDGTAKKISDSKTGNSSEQQQNSDGDGSGNTSDQTQPNNGNGGGGSEEDDQDIPKDFDPSLAGKRFAKVTDLNTGQVWYVPLDCHAESKETEENCDDMLNQARTIWNSNTISKGNIPGHILKEFEKMFKIELPWDEILHRSILYHSQKLDHRNWKERDHYIRCTYLPGKATGQDTQIAIFAIDSSGSIPDDDLLKFIGVVCDSTHHYDKIVVLIHDYIIHMEEWFDNKPSEEEVFERIRKVKGRGGTSHKDVFDRIEEINEEELISVVTFSTDYYSDIECIHHNYRWIKDLPIIFILNSDLNVALSEDYDIKVIKIAGGM
jgi:predicted metal-dependent peptidase